MSDSRHIVPGTPLTKAEMEQIAEKHGVPYEKVVSEAKDVVRQWTSVEMAYRTDKHKH